jgi:hypothetical protein
MNKSQVENLEDLENYYSKVRKIRFKEEDLKFNSIEELFQRYVDANKNDTYFKKGSPHCSPGRGRSIDDFLVIAKTYFPDVTIQEVLKQLKDIIPKPLSNNIFVYVSYCHTIRKNNLWKTRAVSNWFLNSFSNMNFKMNGFTNCDLTVEKIIT